MKKYRVLAMLLSAVLIFEAMTTAVFANTSISGTEDQIRQTLLESADAEKYPGGIIDFLSPRMETSEDIKSAEFAIVRRGPTDSKVTVTFKTIDISAKYGEDYYIEVPSGIFTKKLDSDPDSKTLMEVALSEDNGRTEEASGTVLEQTTEGAIDIAQQQTTEGGIDSLEGPALDSEAYTEEYITLAKDAQEKPQAGGLRAAREAFTGTKSDTSDWREEDKVAKSQVLNAYGEMYEGLPGVEYTVTFDESEYIKKLRFVTINDDISEDEEQVMFVLEDVQGAALSDSPNGYMNIADNEPKESNKFEIMEHKIETSVAQGFAEVTIRRTSGIQRYGTADIGTAELTARSGEDYEPLREEITFMPGQTMQKVKVPILNDSDKDIAFAIKLNNENLEEATNSSAAVVIKAADAKTMKAPVVTYSSVSEEIINGITYRTKTLVVNDTSINQNYSHNGWWGKVLIDGYNTYGYAQYENLDLSAVDFAKIHWKNTSPGTYWEEDHWYWFNKSSGYHKGMGNGIYFGSNHKAAKGDDTFDENTTIPLTDSDRQTKSIKIDTATWGQNRYSYLEWEPIKLYYRPIKINLKTLVQDKDANITPKEWNSKGNSSNKSPLYVGSLAFSGDSSSTEKIYFDDDVVNLEAKYASGREDIADKVYLWGYKIERKGGLLGDKYHYVKGNTINVKKLYSNQLKDINGKTIERKNCEYDNGGVSTFTILPVYKAKNAWVKIGFDEKMGHIANNAFSNGETIKIGMLDTIKYNVVSNTGYFATGFNHAQDNEQSVLVTSDATERVLDDKTVEEGNTAINTGSPLSTIKNSTWQPIPDFKVNPVAPNELSFTPSKNYTHLVAQFSTPRMTVRIDPQSGEQDKGKIVYFNGGSEGQKGDKDNSIIISPIERNKIYPFIGEAAENYRILWKDYTGDLDEDGILSKLEKGYISKYESLLNRTAVVGDFYNYVPVFDNSLIYYSFEPKPQGGKPGIVFGNVEMNCGSVLKNSDAKALSTTPKPVKGATVTVNGHSAATTTDGEFEMKSTDFTTNENHSLVINYQGKNYTGFISVNNYSTITLNEYDSFIPYDFRAYKYTNEKVYSNVDNIKYQEINLKTTSLTNEDRELKLSFRVASQKPNLEAQKAKLCLYTKAGLLRKEYETIFNSDTLRFELSFNPASENVVAGDYLTIQISDQNAVKYMENDVGLEFVNYLGVFNLLNSFKSPANGVIDFVGTIDASFDLGLAGTTDKYMKEYKENGIKTKTIKFGFSQKFEDKYDSSKKKKEESSSGNDKLKDAAKGMSEAKTETEQKAANDKAKNTVNEAVDKTDEENKKKGKVVAGYNITLSASLYLLMEYDDDKKDYFFKELIVSATFNGGVSGKAEVATPVGITLFTRLDFGGEFTAMMVIEQYDYKKFYFDGKGEINFANAGTSDPNRDFTIYGKFIVKPYILIGFGGSILGKLASIELNGRADFDMVFTTSGSGTGKVKLTVNLELTLLGFITKKWNKVNETYNLFDYGTNKSLSSALFGNDDYLYDNIEDYEVASREYLNNRSPWGSSPSNSKKRYSDNKLYSIGADTSNEQILQEGIYPYPYPLIKNISNDEQLVVFLDDNEGDNNKNRTVLKYSIYSNGSWSKPGIIDNDGTNDDSPIIYDAGDKFIVAWSSSANPILDDSEVTQVMNNRDIKSVFFNKASKTFGAISQVTKSTAEDITGDALPSIAYCRSKDGSEKLMITYVKTDYKKTSSTNTTSGSAVEVLVGDIINAYSTVAYRFYDFAKDTWSNSYTQNAKSNLKAELSKEQVDAFEANWYGQGFIDLSSYVVVDETYLLPSDNGGSSSDSGLWSRTPEESEISLVDFQSDPMVVGRDAIGYDDFAISSYVVDLDKNINTTSDREIFLQFYDFKEDYFYPAIRFTNDNVMQSYVTFSETPEGISLFYVSDGNIMEQNIMTLWNDNMLVHTKDSKDVLIINKQKDVYRAPECVIKAKNQSEPITEFIVNTDKDNVLVSWTEKGITYRAGVKENTDEAADANNQYRESQIYVVKKTYGEVQKTPLYEQDGTTPLTYPTINTSGGAIDYNTELDINGYVGVVKAGDPAVMYSRSGEWSNAVAITDEQGANYTDLDFVILPDGRLRGVYVKGMSEVKDVSGKLMAVEDIMERKLATMDFELDKQKFTVEFDELTAFSADTQLPISVTVKNETLVKADNMKVELYQVINGQDIKQDEQTIETIGGGKTGSVTFEWRTPTVMDNFLFKAKVVVNDESMAEATTNIDAYHLIHVENAKISIQSRNTVVISAEATNRGNKDANGEYVFAKCGESIAQTEKFDLAVDKTKAVLLTLIIPDSAFTATQNEDGSIEEKAEIAIYSSGESKVLTYKRTASKEELQTMNNIESLKITDEKGRELLGGVTLIKGENLTIDVAATYQAETDYAKPRVVFVSETPEILEMVGGTVKAVKAGNGRITAYVLPQNSAFAMSEDGFTVNDNFAATATAAVRIIPFDVRVAETSSTTGSSSGSTNPIANANQDTVIKFDNGVAKISAEKLNTLNSLTVTGEAEMKFDQMALKAIVKAGAGEVEIKAVKDAQGIFRINLTVGGKEIRDLGEGSMGISLPYPLGEDVNKDNAVLYSIKDGKAVCLPFAKWEDGKMNFTSSVLSDYQIKVNLVKFEDVSEEDWFYKAINAMSAREIINGLGNGTFAPKQNTKRADFLIMVMKTYGIEPDSKGQNNFADAGDAYYTDYLAKAKELGLVTGVGENKFAPKENISRQDMLVILYNILKKLGRLPVINEQNVKFEDWDMVASYAKVATEYFAEAQIIKGSEGKMNPKKLSQRSEAAQIMYNLIMK